MIDGDLEPDVEALTINSRNQVRPSVRPHEERCYYQNCGDVAVTLTLQ